jgi:glycosyltransferase involved in cell wall biosynthesis
MRIVHVASAREWRGGQKQVWLLATALRALPGTGRPDPPLDQVVVTGRGSELARRLQADGVAVRGVSWSAGIDPRALRAAIGEARRGPCILHAHDGHSVFIAGVAAALTGRPLVATRRVDFHLKRPFFWKRATRVIAVSNAVREVLLKRGFDAARIPVVWSAMDVDAVAATRPFDLRAALGFPADAQVAINAAALAPEKDQATLVESAARLATRLPRLRWVIAGEGRVKADLDRLIAARGLQDRVRLVGFLADPRPWVAASDLMVLSSREEGFGGTLLDALALGVPIVATRTGGIPEVVGPEAGLLAPVGDPEAFAAAVARVLDDDGLRRRLAEAGRRRARDFSHRRSAEAVLDVYREIWRG